MTEIITMSKEDYIHELQRAWNNGFQTGREMDKNELIMQKNNCRTKFVTDRCTKIKFALFC